MAQYKVIMYLSGLPGGLSENDLDARVYGNTKHASFDFTVDEILEENEGEDE